MCNYYLSMKGHSYMRVLSALGWIELGFCAKSEGKILIFMVFLHYIRSKKYQKRYFFWNDNRLRTLSFAFSVFYIFLPPDIAQISQCSRRMDTCVIHRKMITYEFYCRSRKNSASGSFLTEYNAKTP